MFGGGVGRGERPRRMRRDRAIVDDAAAARRLVLHDPERVLGAQKRSGQVGVHHGLPLLEAEILKIHRRCAHAGIVEEHIEPAIDLHHLGEQRRDRSGIGHVGGYRKALADIVAELLGLLQHLHAPPGEHHGKSSVHQRQRCRAPHTGACTGHHGDLVSCLGHLLPAFMFLLLFRFCRVVLEYSGVPRAAPPTSANADRGNTARRPRCGD